MILFNLNINHWYISVSLAVVLAVSLIEFHLIILGYLIKLLLLFILSK